MKKLIAAVFWILLLGAPAVYADCAGTAGKSVQAFPCARFAGEFRKRLQNDQSQNFFSWDARLDLDGVAWRKDGNSVQFRIDFQTVGAKSTGPKVNLAGTSYILEGRFAHQFSKDLGVSVGTTHLSSHLAKDLADLLPQFVKNKTPVPLIQAKDINILFIEAQKRLSLRFPVRVSVRFQPMEFHYRGGSARSKNPLYVKMRMDIARWKEEKIFFVTKHLVGGSQGFNYFESGLDLFPHGQSEGRVQVFLGYAAGNDIKVSPNEGWRHEGFSAGVRLVFHTE